jgi:hypothetical protein
VQVHLVCALDLSQESHEFAALGLGEERPLLASDAPRGLTRLPTLASPRAARAAEEQQASAAL